MIWTSTILFVLIFLAGCSTRSVLVGNTSKPVREATSDEATAIEIARNAVTAREGKNGRSWADRATYEVRRQTNGWSVWVLHTNRDLLGRPRGYRVGGDRRISIDEQGNITKYLHGH